MNSTSIGRSFPERLSVYLARARFFTFSALLHLVLVLLGGSAILFKQITHAPDFQAGDGSFLSTDVAAELPPELQQSPVDPVQAAEVQMPAPAMSAITAATTVVSSFQLLPAAIKSGSGQGSHAIWRCSLVNVRAARSFSV